MKSNVEYNYRILSFMMIVAVLLLQPTGASALNGEQVAMISNSDIEAAISAKLAIAYKNKGSWKLISLKPYSNLQVAKGVDWTIDLPTQPSHSMVVLVKESTSGRSLGWVEATLQRTDPYYVATRSIQTGENLRQEDFVLEQPGVFADVAIKSSDLVVAGDFPQNMRVKRGLVKGSALVLSALEKTPEVTFGETITLVMRSDNIKVTTKAISQGKGAVGDTIPVLVKTYNKTFRGKIMNGKQVEVWL
jgi:flagella basal body P-ring formation protein FlgA